MAQEYTFDVKDVILPDEACDELRYINDEEDKGRWRIGAISADLVDEFGNKYGKQNIRKRVAIEAGMPVSTVRAREEMHRFFPPEVREEFGVLTWSQLRACKPAGPVGWRRLAEWAVESADDFGGRPAPVEAIIAKRKSEEGLDQPSWVRQFLALWKAAEKIRADNKTPPEVKEAAERFMESVGDWYQELTQPAI